MDRSTIIELPRFDFLKINLTSSRIDIRSGDPFEEYRTLQELGEKADVYYTLASTSDRQSSALIMFNASSANTIQIAPTSDPSNTTVRIRQSYPEQEIEMPKITLVLSQQNVPQLCTIFSNCSVTFTATHGNAVFDLVDSEVTLTAGTGEMGRMGLFITTYGKGGKVQCDRAVSYLRLCGLGDNGDITFNDKVETADISASGKHNSMTVNNMGTASLCMNGYDNELVYGEVRNWTRKDVDESRGNKLTPKIPTP